MSQARSVDFPDTLPGRHLRWYFTTRVAGRATAEEVDEHFAPEYRWDWGSPRDPQALEVWFQRWRNLHAAILDIEEVEPLRFVVASRVGGGGVARVWFEMEDAPPHRIVRTATSEAKHAEPGDVARDTEVVAEGDGRYRSSVHPAFTTPNGPFGGYLAALAVRAAGVHSGSGVPHSIACHFLNVGRAGPLTAEVATLRSASRLQSMRVDLVQNGTCLLSALVWAGAEPLAGAPSDGIAKPARQGGQLGQVGRSFRGAMETRMTGERGSTLSGWTRFVPGDAGVDAWLDAARLLLPFDMLAVQAASRAGEREPRPRQLQTLDTSMRFFNQSAHTEWAGCRATAEAADDSIALASATMWSEGDALLAVGTQQVLRRAIQTAAG